MRKSSGSTTNLIVGIALGVLGGVLFAPTRGTNVRSSLNYQFKKYREKLQELIKKLANNAPVAPSKAKTASRDVIEEVGNNAKRLLEDAHELAAQLECDH